MKRSTILCSLLPVLLVLSLCACSASPSGASDGAETPNNIFHKLTRRNGRSSLRSGCPRQPDPLCAGGEAALEGRRLRLLRDKTSRHLRCRCPEITYRLGTGDARQLLRRSPAGWRCRHSRPPARLHQRLPRTVCGHVLRRLTAQPRRIHR